MVMKFAVALMCAGSVWAGAVRADDTSDDVKCLAVSLSMSSSQDQDVQSVGLLSTMYWLGRLDGRSPDLDIEKQITDAAGAMKPADMQAEAARCAAALKTRGEILNKMGEDRRQRERSN